MSVQLFGRVKVLDFSVRVNEKRVLVGSFILGVEKLQAGAQLLNLLSETSFCCANPLEFMGLIFMAFD